jgi:hypothetical protein
MQTMWAKFHSCTGTHPEFFICVGGGRSADPVAIFNLSLMLKTVL